MAVTRSTVASRSSEAQRAATRHDPLTPGPGRGPELLWLALAALIVCGIWALVYTAKVRRSSVPAPAVNLTEVDRAEKLLPVLIVLQNPEDRNFAAQQIFEALADHEGVMPNTGAIARIRIPRSDLVGNKNLEELRKRAEDAKGDTIALFTPAEFAQIKTQIAVRSLNVFRRDFLIWSGAILAAFLLVHIVWSVRRFGGSWAYLPLLLILTGMGFALM